MNLFERLSLRIASHRQPKPVEGWLRIGHRQLYIWLTPAGGLFIAVQLAILLGGINYQSNLAYLLCFLLGCMFLLSLFHSYRNLLQLELTLGHIQPVFAGEPVVLPLLLRSEHPVWSLWVDEQTDLVDIQANQNQVLRLVKLGQKRGYYQIDSLKLHSVFPLGLMRVWSWQRPSSRALIYPKPEDPGYLPSASFSSSDHESELSRAGGDPDSLRPYQLGDSPQRWHWPSYARHGQLVTREGNQLAGEPWLLSLNNLTHEPLERALSILCFWLLEAEQRGLAYGLQLDGTELALAQGHEHLHHCLAALALYETSR